MKKIQVKKQVPIKKQVEEIQPESIFTLSRDTLVDICFLMDITHSMQKYIDSVKTSVQKIVDQLDDIFACGQYCLSFVGYRDFPKENPQYVQFEKSNFEQIGLEYESSYFQKKVNNIKCSGGGDDAEDVRGAIKYAINQLDWQGKLKLIILIADAPAHGKEYNNGGDKYPSEDMFDALKLLKEKNIRLIFLKVGTTEQQDKLAKMGTKIRAQLKEMQSEEFLVETELGIAAESTKELAEQLVACMTDSIQRLIKYDQ